MDINPPSGSRFSIQPNHRALRTMLAYNLLPKITNNILKKKQYIIIMDF